MSPSGRYTIYTNEPPPHRPARRAGRYLLTPTHAPIAPTITNTAAQLRGLRDGQDTIVSEGSNQISVVPHRSILRQSFLVGIGSTALALLHSGHAQVHTDVKFAGQAAIEILGRGRFPVTRESYYVAPRTYQPLGLVERFADGTISVRFTAYQLLAGTLGNHELVTLPGATRPLGSAPARPTTTPPPSGAAPALPCRAQINVVADHVSAPDEQGRCWQTTASWPSRSA